MPCSAVDSSETRRECLRGDEGREAVADAMWADTRELTEVDMAGRETRFAELDGCAEVGVYAGGLPEFVTYVRDHLSCFPCSSP